MQYTCMSQLFLKLYNFKKGLLESRKCCPFYCCSDTNFTQIFLENAIALAVFCRIKICVFFGYVEPTVLGTEKNVQQSIIKIKNSYIVIPNLMFASQKKFFNFKYVVWCTLTRFNHSIKAHFIIIEKMHKLLMQFCKNCFISEIKIKTEQKKKNIYNLLG